MSGRLPVRRGTPAAWRRRQCSAAARSGRSPRPVSRSESGSATHSCDAVQNGAWPQWRPRNGRCPAPAVIRLSSPGRTIACTPALSRCSTSPLNSQLTVCNPVWGCGGTSIPVPPRTSCGTVVVGEAPRPDQRAFALRQCAPHPYRPRPAERHLSRMQHAGEWRSQRRRVRQAPASVLLTDPR